MRASVLECQAARPCSGACVRMRNLPRAYQMAVEDRAECRAQRFSEVLHSVGQDDHGPEQSRILLDGLRFSDGTDDRRYAECTRIEATGKDGASLIEAAKPTDRGRAAGAGEVYRVHSCIRQRIPRVDRGELRTVGAPK